ncbi:hypothetical protein [Paenibacillus sp. yr247]|nr:hypothetical protein [Paenibacillus sp. yr247]
MDVIFTPLSLSLQGTKLTYTLGSNTASDNGKASKLGMGAVMVEG